MQEELFKNIIEKIKYEKLTKRVQILVKPSTFEYLDKLQNEGLIKSKNDLINTLLEDFISRAEENRK